MSQHDLVVDNASGATVRADLNLALQALGSTSKGNAAPSTIYAGQFWLDDNTPSGTIFTLNMYDGSDSISVGHLDTANNWFIPTIGAGSASLPSLVPTGDLNTGLWAPAADTLAFSTGGAEQFRFTTGVFTFKAAAVVFDTASQIRADDSVGASAPAYSFDGDANTGLYRVAADTIGFAVGGSEIARMSSAGLRVGSSATFASANVSTVAASGFGGSFDSSDAGGAGGGIAINRSASDGFFAGFYRAGSAVGSISVSGSTTAYNTTSDIRLKGKVSPLRDVAAKVAAIDAIEFEWKGDGTKAVGFSAQDVYAICPEAVTPGDDASGRPWMMDYSKLVPLLWAQMKSLQDRIHALETP